MKFDPARWNSIYDENAVGYTTFAFRRACEIALDLCSGLCRPSERWLDIGCGTGHLAAKMAALGLPVVAIDYDPGMTAFAKRQFSSQLLLSPPAIAFLNADARLLPLRDATANGLVATSLVGCLDSTNGFYRETRRVLKENGFAVISFTNRQSRLRRVNKVLRSCLGRIGKRKKANAIPLENFRFYDWKTVTHDLEKTGFKVREIVFYNFCIMANSRMFPPPRLAKKLKTRKPNFIVERTAQNFLVGAQKI